MSQEKQSTLDLLLPAVRKVVREEVEPLKRLMHEQRENLVFEQERADQATEKMHEAEEALLALKSDTILFHQSLIWTDNQDRFGTLRREIYSCFKNCVFPNWTPAESPDGIYWKDAFHHAERMHPWAKNLDGATFRRRLNELADKHRYSHPPLHWIVPGYYLLNHRPVLEVLQR